jgi:hypothetical protein
MVPLVSALNKTPNSTGPEDPLSTVAGTIVLGQMVCWAFALVEQANTIANPNSTAPRCLRNFALDVLVVESPLAHWK